jgi:hypothetical protein
MTHTQISNRDYSLWLFIICAQVPVARQALRNGSKPLSFFLCSEIALGILLAILAKTVDGWTFFHWWVGGTVVHELISATLLASIILAIRRLGLPSRQSIFIVQIAVGMSFVLGILSSSFALTKLSSQPYWKICLSWDHAFWYSACCMISFTPIYSWFIAATIPRRQILVLVGLGLYAASQAGIIEIIVVHKTTGIWAQLSNITYCLSLGIWFGAVRSREAQRAHEPAAARIAAISTVSGSNGN